MCKYKVQEKAKLNLLDIINILDLFLKSANIHVVSEEIDLRGPPFIKRRN